MTAFTCELHRPVTPVETLRLPRTAEIIKQKKHSFRNLLLVIHYSKLSIYVPFFSLCVYLYPTISPQIQYTFYSNCLFFSRPQTRSVCSKGRRLSGWSARVPGGRAPSRQRCATADSGSASDDRRRGAAIPGGGEAGALACDGEAEGQRASVRREGWQCVWMRTPTTLTHTHAHRRTHTHARPRTLTHPRIHHTRPHRTLTPTHTFTRSHTHTHAPYTHPTRPHIHAYTLTLAHTCAPCTHTYSHTHAHSHSHTPMRRDDSVNVHGDRACWGDGNSSWQLGDPRRCCAWRFGVWFWGLQACRVPDA